MRNEIDRANNREQTGENQANLPYSAIGVELLHTDADSKSRDGSDFPYKGLNPYTEADANIFFGRDKDIQNVVNNLLAWRLTIVYGKSGVGKSSILRAGVSHTLTEEAKQNLIDFGVPKLAAVVFPPLNGKSSWKGDPFAALMDEVTNAIANSGSKIPPPEPGLSFIDTLKYWTKAVGGEYDDGQLYIVLDQFEEYFLYHMQDQGKDSFSEGLFQALKCPDLRANFLIALREDALATLDNFPQPMPGLFDHRIMIRHLDVDAANDAIKKPIEYYNTQHPEALIAIEPELVDAILEEIQVGKVNLGESGIAEIDLTHKLPSQTQIETPFLQMVMTRLWDEESQQKSHLLRLETYQALGQADQIVKDHLNRQMKALTEEEQQTAANIFQHLVTSSGTKYAYSAPDLADITGFDKTQIQLLLEKLASGENRILRTEGRPQADATEAQSYAIFHDSLAPAILSWRRRYLEHKKRREELAKQRTRWSRRIAWLTGLAVVGTALMVGSVTGWEILQGRRNLLVNQQQLASVEAAQQAETGSQLNALGDAMQVAQIVQTRNLERAKPAATLSLQQILNGIQERNQIPAFSEGQMTVSQTALSESGTLVAAASLDGRVSILSAEGIVQHEFPAHDGPVIRLNWLSNGTRLATASLDGTVALWDAQGNRLAHLNLPPNAGWVLGFSPDGKRLVTSDPDGTVTVWTFQGEKVAAFQAHNSFVLNAQFSPDGTQLATIAGNRVRLWDIAENRLVQDFPSEGAIFFVEFNRDGQQLITAGQAGVLSVWSVATGQKIQDFDTQQGPIYYLGLSPDGTQAATAASDGSVRLWTLQGEDITRLTDLRGHGNVVTGVGFGEAGQVTTLTRNGTVRQWVLHRQPGFAAYGEAGAILWYAQVQYHPDGRSLITYSSQGIAQWDRQPSSIPTTPMRTRPGLTFSSRFDANGQVWFVTTTPDMKTINVQTLEQERPVATVQATFGSFWFAELSPDGKWLATVASSGNTGIAQLWNLTDPQQKPKDLPNPSGALIRRLGFSPDGQWLATARMDGGIELWQVANIGEQPTRTWPVPGTSASVLEFNADGTRLAAGLDNNTVQVWDVQGKPVLPAPLTGHRATITDVHFSPDGQRLLTSSLDGTARLWDFQGNQWAEYPGRENSGLMDATFSPDGQEIATISLDGYVQFWKVESFDQLVKKGCEWLTDYRATPAAQQQEPLTICGS